MPKYRESLKGRFKLDREDELIAARVIAAKCAAIIDTIIENRGLTVDSMQKLIKQRFEEESANDILIVAGYLSSKLQKRMVIGDIDQQELIALHRSKVA